jgi:hypothetical protein
MCGAFPVFSLLAFGNLNNGSGNAGLSYLNGNNTLSNGRWNYVARLSCFDSQTCGMYVHKFMYICTMAYPLCGENRELMQPVSRKANPGHISSKKREIR